MGRQLPERPDPLSDDMVAEAAWALAVTQAWGRYHRRMMWAWRAAFGSCLAAFVLMWVFWGTWTAAIAPFAAVGVVGVAFILDGALRPDQVLPEGRRAN